MNFYINNIDLKFLTLMFVSTFFACTPDVYFKKPVPPNIEISTSIPDKYCGLYYFESDSSAIMVYNNMIVTESVFKYETTLDKVLESENCSVVDGGLHLRGRRECFPFKYISEDTILVEITEMDTIFSFTEDQVLKFDGESIFMNYRNAPEEWATTIIKEDGTTGDFSMHLIMIPNKKRVIKSITKKYTKRLDRDSTYIYIIDPNPKEFKRAIKTKYLKFYDKIISPNLEIETPKR